VDFNKSMIYRAGRLQRRSQVSPVSRRGSDRPARPGGARRLELPDRVVDALVGQLETAIVNTDAQARLEIEMRAHGLLRIHVLVAHEPARFVGADREQREVHDTVALAQLLEMPPVAGVAGEVRLEAAVLNNEAAPQ
jgi:hypothetical protein